MIARFVLGLLLVLSSLFLILLVLIQRGRGGGLAGALGGAGGQSAFGTKAGDVFTKITIGVAAFWILLCILALNVLGRPNSLFNDSLGSAAPLSTGNTPVGGSAAGTGLPIDAVPGQTAQEPGSAGESAPPAAPEAPAAVPAESSPETAK
jgi:preprotein translocase subunit SecG